VSGLFLEHDFEIGTFGIMMQNNAGAADCSGFAATGKTR